MKKPTSDIYTLNKAKLFSLLLSNNSASSLSPSVNKQQHQNPNFYINFLLLLQRADFINDHLNTMLLIITYFTVCMFSLLFVTY